MNKLQKLQTELQDIDAKIDALLAGDDLDEAQQAEHDALVEQRAKTTKAISREHDRLRREEERTRLEEEAERAETNARTREERQVTAPVNGGRITDRDRPTPPTGRVPATVAARKVKLPSGAEVEETWLHDPHKGFTSHLDFLKSVMDAGIGIRSDPRLRNLSRQRREGDPDGVRGSDFVVPLAFSPTPIRISGLYNSRGKQLTAGSDEQGMYSDPYGGFLVRPGFRPEMLRVMPEGDPMGQYTTKLPMDTPAIDIPARVDRNHTTSVSGGLRVYRRSETQTSSSSRMEMELVHLQLAALFGVAYATEELLSRSLISFLALLTAGFSDEFNAKLIRERLNGTGTGQYEGVLNSDAIVSVAKETGQAADTIVLDNIIKMRSRCWGYGKSIWLANHDTLPQLLRLNATVGTAGIPYWLPSAREDTPDMLLGRPIYFSEFLPKLGDTGDILLGNWAEYLEGQGTPLQNDESHHVRFLEHERVFKFWVENAGKLWWRSALTPATSASTLSPFVKLDAR